MAQPPLFMHVLKSWDTRYEFCVFFIMLVKDLRDYTTVNIHSNPKEAHNKHICIAFSCKIISNSMLIVIFLKRDEKRIGKVLLSVIRNVL